jgi:hypothetical protein
MYVCIYSCIHLFIFNEVLIKKKEVRMLLLAQNKDSIGAHFLYYHHHHKKTQNNKKQP